MKVDFTKMYKFLITGGLATLAHYFTMFIFIYFGVWATISTFIGAMIGAVINYILQYYITFKAKEDHFVTIVRYSTSVFLSIVSNTFVFWFFDEKLYFATVTAQIIATAFVTLQNFTLYQYFVFLKK